MKSLIAHLILFGLVILSPVYSAAEEHTAALTVEDMADSVIAHFPRAEGKVTYADESKVKLNIGTKEGLKAGMEILLYRPGKPIRHPVTKQILGSREEALGSAVLTDVGDSYSEGKIKELKVTQVIPGDVGRLSTERARLVIALYGKDYNELVLDRLSNRLRSSGRFDMEGTAELPKGPDASAAAVKALIKEKSAQYLVTLRTTPLKKQDKSGVELVLYSSGGEVVEKRAGEADITSAVYGESVMEFPLVKGEHRDFYHQELLPFRARHLAAGNITGQGKVELAVSDGRGITVYRFEDGALHELWREGVSKSNEHLSVECADFDKDGTDEIYVTNFVNGAPSSYVIEYDGKAFKTVARDVPVFFRVLDVPGVGRKLITSTLGADAPYSGVIREYVWEGGELRKGGTIGLPDKIKDPYGFALVDLFPGKEAGDKDPLKKMEIVWVDDSDYLQVLDMKGKRIWKSKERYGGYDDFFEVNTKNFVLPNVDNRGKVKGRLIVRQGPEGRQEVVLTKNIPMTYITRRFRGYSGAEVYSLSWDGKEMSPNWSIRNIEGYLADIYMGDSMNNGREGITILTNPTIKIQKKSRNLPIGSLGALKDIVADRASLLVYKIPQR